MLALPFLIIPSAKYIAVHKTSHDDLFLTIWLGWFWYRVNRYSNFGGFWSLISQKSGNMTKILTEIWSFDLKNDGLAELAWPVTWYLWRGSLDLKIISMAYIFTIIFMSKLVSNPHKNFCHITWHQKPKVKYHSILMSFFIIPTFVVLRTHPQLFVIQ